MQPHIYLNLSKEKLEEVLTSLHYCTDLPVKLIDETGNLLFHIGKDIKFCSVFSDIVFQNYSCENTMEKATKMAMQFGGPYIFSCASNLNNIVFPLVYKNVLFGSVFIGPFLMDEADILIHPNINNLFKGTSKQILDLYATSNEIKFVSPALVTHISKLLFYSLNNLQSSSPKQVNIRQDKLYQQSKINEAIQLYKTGTMPITSSYPIDKEKDLIAKAKSGDTKNAKILLNDLLGYVFFSKGSNLESVKFRSIELCSLLSRAVIEGGAPSTNILSVNELYLQSLQSINSIEELCYKLQNIIDIFIESMYYKFTDANNKSIKIAIKYIATHFSSTITLKEIASYVNLSPAYFSSLFKKNTKVSYSEYLNYVRIEESKRLLSNTDYPVLDIAIATGFEDQSYFSKVFKKYTGFSPAKYRK